MDSWSHITLLVIVQLFMLVGLAGLVVPVFPGLTVIWLSALGYGILSGFRPLGIALFILIVLLGLGGEILDNILMSAGARKAGASWLSIVLALVVGILGTLLLPPIGGIIGAPLVVLLLEYSRLKDWNKAWQALRGMAAGWGLSLVTRFGVGLVMIVLWWVWVWKG